MLLGRFRRRLAGVALIDLGQLHALARGFLHRLGEGGHLSPILLVGRRDVRRAGPPESFVYFELISGGHTTLACRALRSHRPSRFIQILVNRR